MKPTSVKKIGGFLLIYWGILLFVGIAFSLFTILFGDAKYTPSTPLMLPVSIVVAYGFIAVGRYIAKSTSSSFRKHWKVIKPFFAVLCIIFGVSLYSLIIYGVKHNLIFQALLVMLPHSIVQYILMLSVIGPILLLLLLFPLLGIMWTIQCVQSGELGKDFWQDRVHKVQEEWTKNTFSTTVFFLTLLGLLYFAFAPLFTSKHLTPLDMISDFAGTFAVGLSMVWVAIFFFLREKNR